MQRAGSTLAKCWPNLKYARLMHVKTFVVTLKHLQIRLVRGNKQIFASKAVKSKIYDITEKIDKMKNSQLSIQSKQQPGFTVYRKEDT